MSGLHATWWDAECAAALSDAALLAAMQRYEGALALASERVGLIPAGMGAQIAQACAAVQLDVDDLALAARDSAVLTVPFVKQLTMRVAAVSPEAARWLHYGSTSQDVIDSALSLCLREAGGRVLALLERLGEAAAGLAETHAGTPMAGRTLLQAAVPIPFGFKAAVWLGMCTRSRAQFAGVLRAACVLQAGGPVGTLSAYGGRGADLARELGRELELPVPATSWHAARDSYARLGAEAAILAGAAGKIARDVALMMQPEIGEAFEPAAAGRGGSSAMPHKRNPVGCTLALEAAQRAPGLAASLLGGMDSEHERGLGQWQGQMFVLRDLLASCANGVAAMAEVLEGLRVEPQAMRANIDRLGGLAFSEAVAVALAAKLGKAEAHALTEALCARAVREGITLEQALRGEARALDALGADAVAGLFDPAGCFGAAATMIAAAVRDWRAAAG
ncbi:MAG: 3-carboxy-cis,cis-muconate cycloisomerase [Betaproteobacteria bacterium]|nr:3-carboxy-cis,cis-muconate cycloisomerase [Betaproteobacteria bacterium]